MMSDLHVQSTGMLGRSALSQIRETNDLRQPRYAICVTVHDRNRSPNIFLCKLTGYCSGQQYECHSNAVELPRGVGHLVLCAIGSQMLCPLVVGESVRLQARPTAHFEAGGICGGFIHHVAFPTSATCCGLQAKVTPPEVPPLDGILQKIWGCEPGPGCRRIR